MVSATRHGLLSRVRSTRKLRSTTSPDEDDTSSSSSSSPHNTTTTTTTSTHHRRNQSDTLLTRTTSLRADYYKSTSRHWPPLEFDPLQLNPLPAAVAPTPPPARLHERQPLFNNNKHRSPTPPPFAAAAARTISTRRRPHRSDSGFDFALERDKVLLALDVDQRSPQRGGRSAVGAGWPSPAGSVDSGKSWFDDDDDDEEWEEGEEEEMMMMASSPQRRPQVGSPDDPGYFMKRGAWKRRGIFFGVRAEEVHQKEDDAFDL